MGENNTSQADFRVGEWLVQPTLAKIRRGGDAVHITPRAMAVLVHLANAKGAVVSRNELLDAVWPRMAVTQDALTQCIVELRKAFRDNPKSPTVIETIHKVGIRLVAPIAPVEAQRATDPEVRQSPASAVGPAENVVERRPWLPSRRTTLAAALAIAAALGTLWLVAGRSPSRESGAGVAERNPSIAVLPFSYAAATGEDVALFADGLQAELASNLAKLSAFDKVSAPTSTQRYRDHRESLREIGRQLDVATILEAHVQRVGNDVRIVTTLSDAETEATIATATYDRALTLQDLFAVQSELAVSIANALEATLTAEDLAGLNRVPTTNARALAFYQRGKEYFRRSNNRLEELPIALQQYERATAEDPGFAAAWARLGVAHTGLYFYGIDRTPARLELAEQAIRKAFDLVPSLPEAHLAWANYLYRGRHKYDEALTEFAVAERSSRNDPDLFFFRGSLYRQLGNWQASIDDVGRALELDPLNVVYLRQQHVTFLNLRDYARAEQYLERVVEIAPDDSTAYVDRALLHLFRDGDTALAKEYAQSPPTARYGEGLAYTYVRWLAAIYDRDYGAALRVLDSVSDETIRSYNSWRPKALLYARTHKLAGNSENAQSYYRSVAASVGERLAATLPEDVDVSAVLDLAEAEAGLGRKELALEGLARANDSIPRSRSRDPVRGARPPIDEVIGVLLLLGDEDRAFEEIELYFSSSVGPWSFEGLARDPRLQALGNDPRFAALRAKYSRR